MHPTPVLTQCLEQLRTERYVAVTVPLAVPDMDEHAHAVDVLHLEMTQFGPAHTGRIQRHQHGAMKEIAGRIDEPDRFFLRQDDRQAARRSRIRHFFDRIVPLQRFAEEEAQCRNVVADRSHVLLSLLQQIQLVGPDLVWPELVRCSLEVLCEIRDGLEVSRYSSLCIITTLEFFQHQFA